MDPSCHQTQIKSNLKGNRNVRNVRYGKRGGNEKR